MVLAVGDFNAIGQVSWLLYRECFAIAGGAPPEFRLLLEELKTLHMMMKSFEEEFGNPDSVLARAGEDRQKMITKTLVRLNESLDILNRILCKNPNSNGRLWVKRSWDKFKWASDVKEVNGMRSKLSYHNGILGLFLVCAGKSSLEHIENTTSSVDDGLQQLNNHLQRAFSGTLQQTSTPSAPLASTSTLETDNAARWDFCVQCMKAAEVSQRWFKIDVDGWIKAGRWWLLRANIEFRNRSGEPNGENMMSQEGYLNLLKASWILTDVITVHPQFALIESSIQYEIMQLIQDINQEFKLMEDLNTKLPALAVLNNVVIWEGYTQSPTPKIEPQGHEGRNWIMEDEMIIYQSFGNYHPHDLMVCISVVVNSSSNQARLVLHDQSWRILFKVHVLNLFAPNTDSISLQNTTVSIGNKKVVLSTTQDAAVLHATLILYGKYHPILTGLPDPISPYHDAFIFLIALKMNKTDDPAMPRNLARMKRYQQSHGSVRNGAHSFLRQFNMVVDRLGLEAHEASGSLAPLNEPSVKGEKFREYAYSLLGWVLHHHLDVGIEWVQIRLKTQRQDTESPEDLFLPPVAISRGDHELLKLWLETGLDPTDLMPAACREGNHLIIQLLLDHGASSNVQVNADMTAEQYTAQNGLETGLIDRGGKVECQGIEGQTNHQSLHFASEAGDDGTVKLLLDRGAQIEFQEKKGLRALHVASRAGRENVVGLLLARRAEIECQDKNRWRPLHFASFGRHEDVVRLLLDRGAEIECQEESQCRPLHLASSAGHEGVVRLLLDRGAEIECQEQQHRTPLHRASFSGHEGVVRLLLDRGAEIECQEKSQCRPLHYASSAGHEGVVRLLLDRRAEIECKGKSQWRPLHFASSAGHEDVVRLLLDRGAIVNPLSKQAKTPLELAKSKSQRTVIEVLEGYISQTSAK